jgi:aminoglycoside phosphotransferase (APT) family kinase protein
MAPEAELAARLARYCRWRRPEAEQVRVAGLRRVFGGASRETWRFELHERAGGRDAVHPLILRRDPAASLIDTERRREFAACRAFEGTGVPVPRTWWLEEDPSVLGQPFFVMSAVEGCESGPMKLQAPPFATHHARIAEQLWTALGRIARTDPGALGEAAAPVAADAAWRRELDHWSGAIDGAGPEPQPIARAAIRWLHAHPPPPAQRVGVVHGDFRVGNVLVAPDGELRAVLDWEMAHAGDPLEDLAWSLSRIWCFAGDDRAGGLARREDAIAWWERASGLRAEPAALHWWLLFSAVKGQAIWLGAARAFERGENRDLMMPFAAWTLGNLTDRAILELMGWLP